MLRLLAVVALISIVSACAPSLDQTCVPGKHEARNGVMYVTGPYGTQWRCTEDDIAKAVARYNAR